MHPLIACAELPGAGHGVFDSERRRVSHLVGRFLDEAS
jgi:hypothetical protein